MYTMCACVALQVNNLPGVRNGNYHLSNSAENYSTSVIGNRSIEFIKSAVAGTVINCHS